MCVYSQASHTFHLSAVSPSYYRFHTEHLQDDQYSKDKVPPSLLNEPWGHELVSLELMEAPLTGVQERRLGVEQGFLLENCQWLVWDLVKE